MILEGKLGKLFCEVVKPHVGHKIVAVCYYSSNMKRSKGQINVSIECETCDEVIIDADAREKK